MTKISEELQKAITGEISSDEMYETIKYSTTKILERIYDKSRWITYYEYIVQDEDNRYWSFIEGQGSTEYQDNEKFDIYTIHEVEPYEKIIIDYRPI